MPLARRRVLIRPDNDTAGFRFAADDAAIVAALEADVSILDARALAAMNPTGGQREPLNKWDAANALAEWPDIVALRSAALSLAKSYAAVHAAVEDEKPALEETKIEHSVAELSALNEISYAVARAPTAKELGIPVVVLDKLVKSRRPKDDPGKGRSISFPSIERWPEPVDGAAMLDELVAALRRYIVRTNAQVDAAALWIVFTHVHDAFDVSPRLVVKSPQKRSGKTTLFSVLRGSALGLGAHPALPPQRCCA